MLTTDFYEILTHSPLKCFFKGVYAADQIPTTIKKSQFIICNIDTSNSNGSHWYVIYRPTSKILECFDSLGVTESKKQFLKAKFNFRGIEKIKCNITCVQPPDSISCGEFCMFFIYNRIFNKDLSFSELLNLIFVDDNSSNETTVSTFFNEIVRQDLI